MNNTAQKRWSFPLKTFSVNVTKSGLEDYPKELPKVLWKALINNHRKNAKSEASILACKHFKKKNHNLQQHAEFTLIKQIKKQTTATEARILLKWRENFWIFELKTLYLDGFTQELNNID